jgi:hypothetical protein
MMNSGELPNFTSGFAKNFKSDEAYRRAASDFFDLQVQLEEPIPIEELRNYFKVVPDAERLRLTLLAIGGVKNSRFASYCVEDFVNLAQKYGLLAKYPQLLEAFAAADARWDHGFPLQLLASYNREDLIAQMVAAGKVSANTVGEFAKSGAISRSCGELLTQAKEKQ